MIDGSTKSTSLEYRGEEYIKCGDEDGINGCGEIISGKKEVPKTYISGIILPVISIEKRF